MISIEGDQDVVVATTKIDIFKQITTHAPYS